MSQDHDENLLQNNILKKYDRKRIGNLILIHEKKTENTK